MAERVGFEPTYRLITDNSISSRARYGLFATFPQTCVVHEVPPAGKPFFRSPHGGTLPPTKQRGDFQDFLQLRRRKNAQPSSMMLPCIQACRRTSVSPSRPSFPFRTEKRSIFKGGPLIPLSAGVQRIVKRTVILHSLREQARVLRPYRHEAEL